MTNYYFLKKINEEFVQRKEKNRRYSLRAFSCYLEMHSATLSAILKLKRPIPERQLNALVEKLNLSVGEKSQFIESARSFRKHRKEASKKPPLNMPIDLVDRVFVTIFSEWEHSALVSLMKTPEFQSDCHWVACRLGISIERVGQLVSNLQEVELLKVDITGKYFCDDRAWKLRKAQATSVLHKAFRDAKFQALSSGWGDQQASVDNRDDSIKTSCRVG